MATHSSILCLENKMDRGAWWATVHGVTKSRTRLSSYTHTHTIVYYKLTFLENAEFPLFPLSSCLVYICTCLANSDAGGRKENV